MKAKKRRAKWEGEELIEEEHVRNERLINGPGL